VWLWGWLAFRIRIYDNSLGVDLPLWTGAFGIPVMALGTLVALLCVGAFVVRGHGTPAPFDAPREFVAIGPYKYVRNPMYIGGWTVLFGLGLYLRSISILILSFAMLLLAHLFIIFYEEPALGRRFGATYKDYCASVNRWLPAPARAQREK